MDLLSRSTWLRRGCELVPQPAGRPGGRKADNLLQILRRVNKQMKRTPKNSFEYYNGLRAVTESVNRCPVCGQDCNLIFQGYRSLRPQFACSQGHAEIQQQRLLSQVMGRKTLKSFLEESKWETTTFWQFGSVSSLTGNAGRRQAWRTLFIAKLVIRKPCTFTNKRLGGPENESVWIKSLVSCKQLAV